MSVRQVALDSVLSVDADLQTSSFAPNSSLIEESQRHSQAEVLVASAQEIQPFGGVVDSLIRSALGPSYNLQTSVSEGIAFFRRMMSEDRVLQTGNVDQPGEYPYVGRLQTMLNHWYRINGFSTRVLVTGIYDEQTARMLRGVQGILGISQTGQFGSTTSFYMLPTAYPYEALGSRTHSVEVTGYSRVINSNNVATANRKGTTVEDYLQDRSVGPVTIAAALGRYAPGSLYIVQIPDPSSPSGFRNVPGIVEDTGDPDVVKGDVFDIYFSAEPAWIDRYIQRVPDTPAIQFRNGYN